MVDKIGRELKVGDIVCFLHFPSKACAIDLGIVDMIDGDRCVEVDGRCSGAVTIFNSNNLLRVVQGVMH